MITCYLRYVIDPDKISDFEAYGLMWIPLVEKFGGKHHGYFLPHEGANNIALALFSFPSLAAYERYRIDSQHDPACHEAYEFARQTKCIISYERSFMRPVLGDVNNLK
ncbi:NIPSNAP family protein [Anabaena sp. UHCC 0399]|uniref:NIPSNAP family protein n=1 Tax=Anabaena sp. UHCC 0399 TaxID=3110238 RepID=UPI002B1EC6D9|nr:NIPSNAP family protein [Anabaena sp. UHCC 0399]MEA5564951.1 NIPSNAP family protein [Anabaena sp. UHCC 0399]